MTRSSKYLLSVILGIVITTAFNALGFIKGDIQQFIAATATIVLMYICIDISLWIARKVTDGKKQKETKLCDTTDN